MQSVELVVAESVIRAVARAREESRMYGSRWIGTDHLLLGILGDKKGVLGHKRSFAAQTLFSRGVTLRRAREQVERMFEGHEPGVEGEVEFSFGPEVRRVVERMRHEARQRGDSYMGVEHLLLGLLKEPEGGAARVLSEMEVSPNEVRQEVLQLLGPGGEDPFDEVERRLPQ